MFSLLAVKKKEITRLFTFSYMLMLTLSSTIVLSIKAIINLPNIFYTLGAVVSLPAALCLRELASNEVECIRKCNIAPISEVTTFGGLFKLTIYYTRAACIGCTICALLISNVFYILFLCNLRVDDLIISGISLLTGVASLALSNNLCEVEKLNE